MRSSRARFLVWFSKWTFILWLLDCGNTSITVVANVDCRHVGRMLRNSLACIWNRDTEMGGEGYRDVGCQRHEDVRVTANALLWRCLVTPRSATGEKSLSDEIKGAYGETERESPLKRDVIVWSTFDTRIAQRDRAWNAWATDCLN